MNISLFLDTLSYSGKGYDGCSTCNGYSVDLNATNVMERAKLVF